MDEMNDVNAIKHDKDTDTILLITANDKTQTARLAKVGNARSSRTLQISDFTA